MKWISTACGWVFVCLIAVGALWPAPARPAGAELYGRLPQAELLRLSPSGERVAMIALAGERRQLLIIALAGNKTLKALDVGDSKVRGLTWAGNEHVLITFSGTTPQRSDFVGRFELGGVLQVGLDDKPAWTVFGKSDNIEHTVTGYYGASVFDGHWSGYFSGITLERRMGFGDYGYLREHTYSDLYRVDLETGKPVLVLKGSDRDPEWVLNPDGSVGAYANYAQASGEWLLYGGPRHNTVLLRKITPTREVSLVGLGRTAGTVLVIDRTGENDVAHEMDVGTGKTQELFAGNNVRHELFDSLTGLLVGAATIEEPGATFFDPAMQKRFNISRKAFPLQQVHLESFTQNLNQMIVFTDGTADSGTYWFVDLATHHADPIGYAYPDIKPEAVGAIRTIRFPSLDGLSIEGILTLPPGRDPKRLPLVVFPHGGPMDEADRVGFDWWAQAFAARGYVVLQPNFRGSSGYGVGFRKAGVGEWGHKMLDDIAAGIGDLATQQIIDPSRVCIMGASYGGYAALAGVTVQQHLYRCAVSVSGPANLATFAAWLAERHELNGEPLRYWRKVTGADTRGDASLTEISPTHFAARADAPILLIHGQDDTVVPIDQSRQMAAALKAASKPYEYVELALEDHYLTREVTRRRMLEAAIGFVEKNNPAQ